MNEQEKELLTRLQDEIQIALLKILYDSPPIPYRVPHVMTFQAPYCTITVRIEK